MTKSTLVLSCKHVIRIANPAPVKGEEQYCLYCAEYRIVDFAPPSYSLKCKSGHCTFGRHIGADMNKALAVARKHTQVRQSHRVLLKDGLLTIAEITNTEEQLFVLAEERAVIAADSSKMLKDLGQGSTGQPDIVR